MFDFDGKVRPLIIVHHPMTQKREPLSLGHPVVSPQWVAANIPGSEGTKQQAAQCCWPEPEKVEVWTNPFDQTTLPQNLTHSCSFTKKKIFSKSNDLYKMSNYYTLQTHLLLPVFVNFVSSHPPPPPPPPRWRIGPSRQRAPLTPWRQPRPAATATLRRSRVVWDCWR